ncbi:MAG: choice-of-anchor L domain-containing protein [Flavobacteriales bacterium]|nr:choice-of-anchor L domain-containing protein [Flavobacteriales bacterium]
MKKLATILFAAGCVLAGQAQINVDSDIDAVSATEGYFLSNGVFVNNITFSGGNEQVGIFDCVDCNVGIGSGLILATGDAVLVQGPNELGSSTVGGGNFGAGDADLEMLVNGMTINDASILEFDFLATGDSLAFEFVFGSEEYPEFVNSSFNDVFGFFVSGPGITGPYSNGAVNIALVPGTDLAVAINNVNDGLNSDYYVDNSTTGTDETQIALDGFTTVLTAAIGSLTIGETYHIKLAIGDAGDSAFDSAIFLSDNSFVQFCSEVVQFAPVDCQVSEVDYDFNYTIDCGHVTLHNISEVNIDADDCAWDMGDGSALVSGCQSVYEHTYDSPGTYEVKLIYSYGEFQAMEIKSIYVSDVAPATPVIAQAGETLTVTNWDGVSAIQWYYNGEMLSGATEESVDILGNGTYMVTFENGCLNSAETTVTSTEEYTKAGIHAYPNPTAGMINLELPQDCIQLSVYNALGQLEYSTNTTRSLIQLDLKFSGMKWVVVLRENGDLERIPVWVNK